MRKITIILTMVIGLAVSGSARATLIDITDGIAFSIAQDGSVSNVEVSLSQSFAAPFTQTAAIGGSSSTTTYDNVLSGATQTLSCQIGVSDCPLHPRLATRSPKHSGSETLLISFR